MLEKLEFKRMHEQMFGRGAARVPREPERDTPARTPTLPPANAGVVARYRRVDTVLGLRELARDLAARSEIAVDTETSGLDPMRATLAGIAIATEPGDAVYVPIASEIDDGSSGQLPGLLPATRAPGLPLDAVRDALSAVFASERPTKIGQNIKFDAVVLTRAGLPLGGIAFDTMLASYSLDPARRSHGLDALALECLGHRMIPFEDLFDRRVREKDIRRVPLDARGRVCVRRRRLHAAFEARVRAHAGCVGGASDCFTTSRCRSPRS